MITPDKIALSADVVREVVGLAGLAPSIHNTQPWRWRCDGSTLELFADPDRMLTVADPNGRQLLISCGAALLYARLALRSQGLRPSVTAHPPADGVAPNGTSPLATIHVTGATADTGAADSSAAAAGDDERELVASMRDRHTDRRPFQPRPLPADAVAALRRAAEVEGTWLKPFEEVDDRVETAVLLAHAEWIESHDPAYLAELRRWSRTGPDATDGIPRTSVVGTGAARQSEFILRDFDVTGVPGLRLESVEVERPTVVALGTDTDGPRDWLQAGQALGRVLLTITGLGAAASPLGQVLDVDTTRTLLRDTISGLGHVQMLLRVGYPLPDASPLPPAPRRRVEEILTLA
jgi:hypothetical protein